MSGYLGLKRAAVGAIYSVHAPSGMRSVGSMAWPGLARSPEEGQHGPQDPPLCLGSGRPRVTHEPELSLQPAPGPTSRVQGGSLQWWGAAPGCLLQLGAGGQYWVFLPPHRASLCFFCSELRPLPDPSGHRKGQLRQGKEEPARRPWQDRSRGHQLWGGQPHLCLSLGAEAACRWRGCWALWDHDPDTPSLETLKPAPRWSRFP